LRNIFSLDKKEKLFVASQSYNFF